MKLSAKGIALIQGFEDFRAKPYYDGGMVATIGYGTTLYPDGKAVKITDPAITKSKAVECMMYHISKRIVPVMPPKTNQNQYDALCSFIYNVGANAFKNSTLLKKILAGAIESEIRFEFMRWNKDNGQAVKGLTRRRQAEADYYFAPMQASNRP